MLDTLHEIGFAEVEVSTTRNAVSSVVPTVKFATLVGASGVTLNDFGRHPEEECIHLTRKLTPKEDTSRRERLDHKDTATTGAMREKLRRLNGFLAAADVAFVADGLAPGVNDRNRRLTRRFFIGPDERPRFDQGERLFGGFWQALALVAHRRHAIRIDGEPVADLDYSSMFVRLAYAHLGETPPAGDLYALPGLEGYRRATSKTRPLWPPEMGVGDDTEALERPNGTWDTLQGGDCRSAGRDPPG